MKVIKPRSHLSFDNILFHALLRLLEILLRVVFRQIATTDIFGLFLLQRRTLLGLL